MKGLLLLLTSLLFLSGCTQLPVSGENCLNPPAYCGERYFSELENTFNERTDGLNFSAQVKKYTSDLLGIQFEYLVALPDNDPFHITEKGNMIFVDDYPLMEVFSRNSKSDVAIEIGEKFLSEEAKQQCSVYVQEEKNRIFATIKLNDQKLVEKNDEMGKTLDHPIDITNSICGGYSGNVGVSYFVTAPGWDKTFFLRIGQSWPVLSPISVEPLVQ